MRIPQAFGIVLIIAFLIRLLVSLYSFQYRENTDVLRYRDWATIAYLHSFLDSYTKPQYLTYGSVPNNMPPGTLYIASGMYWFNIQITKPILKITGAAPGTLQWVNGALLNFSLRIPSLIADFVIGLLIYWFVRKKTKENKAILASSFFLFNPAALYNSAFWGQMDAINNAFFFLALFFLLRKQYLFVIPAFFLSLYVKLSLIFLLPLLLLILFFKVKSKLSLAFSTLFGVGVIILLTLPISNNPSWLWNYLLQNGLGEMQNITAFTFNFWWVVFNPLIKSGSPLNLFSFSDIRLIGSPLDNQVYFGLPLNIWALILFLLFLSPILYKVVKLKEKITRPEYLFILFSIVSLIGFLFLPRMHERYLYPIFPLLAIYIGLTGRFLWTYVALSLLNLINVYIVWHPMMLPFFPYQLMNSQIFQWIIAFLTVGVGLTFYYNALKTLKSSEK